MENTAMWHDACEETELDIFENIEQFIRLEGNSGSGYARVEFPPGYSFSRSGTGLYGMKNGKSC